MNEVVEMNYRKALNEALRQEMVRDETVFIIGEDIGIYGGMFGVTRGLLDEFGEKRVIDTPISEAAIIGSAIGAARTGLRPIAEIMFGGFVCVCFDALYMKLGTWQQTQGGNLPLPVVVRMAMGAAVGGGLEQSMCPEALLAHSPGLTVIAPSTPYDAKGLLTSAIRADFPVIFLEHVNLYRERGNVPINEYCIPIGKAEVKRKGKDVTVATYSAMVQKSLIAADQLADDGIDVEVLDLRTLVTVDEEAVIESVKKTTRLVVAQESMSRAGYVNELISIVMEKCFEDLDAPIKKVAAADFALPHDAKLEALLVPQVKDIVQAVKGLF